MEQNFQTSFIPKKPIVEKRATASRPVGFSTVVSVFLFFAMLLALGGMYFYKKSLTSSIASMEKDLTLAKNRFEPEKISQLELLDRRLQAAEQVLAKHTAISPIFKSLQEITMKTVQYTSFSYEDEPGSTMIRVRLAGNAVGYRSVALQSDLFAKNKYFIDPVFSNLTLGDAGEVRFDLEFLVDPAFIDYKQMLQTQNQAVVGADESFNSTPVDLTNIPSAPVEESLEPTQ